MISLRIYPFCKEFIDDNLLVVMGVISEPWEVSKHCSQESPEASNPCSQGRNWQNSHDFIFLVRLEAHASTFRKAMRKVVSQNRHDFLFHFFYDFFIPNFAFQDFTYTDPKWTTRCGSRSQKCCRGGCNKKLRRLLIEKLETWEHMGDDEQYQKACRLN